MYISSTRSTHSIQNGAIVGPDVHRRFEYVKSWRTGTARDYKSTLPPERSGSTSLLDFINRSREWASRQEYLPDDRIGDNGHAFTSFQLSQTAPGQTKVTDYRNPNREPDRRTVHGSIQGPMLTKPMLAIARLDPIKWGWTTNNPIGNSDSIHGTLKRDLVTAYAGMSPSPRFGWGETFTELLRGNLPRAIVDIVKRVDKVAPLDVLRWKESKEAASTLGGEYLGVRFGIEPILKDIYATVESLIKVQDTMNITSQRSSTTRTRVQEIPKDSIKVSGVLEGAGTSTYSGSIIYDSRVSCKLFKAHRSQLLDSYLWRAEEFLVAMGVDMRLAWDLSPWSWLIDWSGAIGASISNAQTYNVRRGRYRLHYAWETTLIKSNLTAQYSGSDRTYASGIKTRERSNAFSISRSAKYLNREVGNPGTVGAKPADFSAYQLSILAALGLSRA